MQASACGHRADVIICAIARETRTVEESKSIDHQHMPAIVIAASGMATGGRVLHHLKVFAPEPRNTVPFAGFQAGGTRGAAMLAGAPAVKIPGFTHESGVAAD